MEKGNKILIFILGKNEYTLIWDEKHSNIRLQDQLLSHFISHMKEEWGSMSLDFISEEGKIVNYRDVLLSKNMSKFKIDVPTSIDERYSPIECSISGNTKMTITYNNLNEIIDSQTDDEILINLSNKYDFYADRIHHRSKRRNSVRLEGTAGINKIIEPCPIIPMPDRKIHQCRSEGQIPKLDIHPTIEEKSEEIINSKESLMIDQINAFRSNPFLAESDKALLSSSDEISSLVGEILVKKMDTPAFDQNSITALQSKDSPHFLIKRPLITNNSISVENYRKDIKSVNANENMMSRLDVSIHNTRDDMWIIISNNIYDVTKWATKHPGGVEILLQLAGKDATTYFSM